MTSTQGERKHEIVYQRLLTEIQQVLQPHDPLPSERELTARYQMSRATVREAMRRLEEEGWVYRQQGSGTYVADPATISKSLALTSFSEDMRARRLTPGSKLLSWQRIPATAEVARDLGLSPGTPVVYVERLRLADGSPMCVEQVWILATVVGDVEESRLGGSLYETLTERGAAPHHADQIIAATVTDPDQSALLGVPPFSPALHVTRVTFDAAGRAVERGESVYRADRYSYRITVTRRTA
ncbi:GntR family transcriptional regulator [Dactylosporangium aurantiacum]|uniref:GntR family transcriptional regulator n=1 Tax=Dactylosporangium aurantiacum TaxID=35754 RepID=A0A9Q9I9T7_9ACTN|nr:GntR family transcriptional regulator [Dactylosporangium aurantiacum]MDG6103425.1 GntR family transcriptional regulator [Dactylosporangium aurantiacum]UWZ52067.1 GntR family transcriptional regulator [Dactylosporangium aurantiacum]